MTFCFISAEDSDASFPEIPGIADILIFQKISLEFLDFLLFCYCDTSGPRNRKKILKNQPLFTTTLVLTAVEAIWEIPMQGVHVSGGLSYP